MTKKNENLNPDLNSEVFIEFDNTNQGRTNMILDGSTNIKETIFETIEVKTSRKKYVEDETITTKFKKYNIINSDQEAILLLKRINIVGSNYLELYCYDPSSRNPSLRYRNSFELVL